MNDNKNLKNLGSKKQTILNSLSFQVMWFATIYLASKKLALLAFIPTISLSSYYVFQTHPKLSHKDRGLWALIGLGLGFISELFFWYLDLFTAIEEPLILIPLWLLGLWVTLFIMLPIELSALIKRPILAAGLAFISAPFSYISGAKLGAMIMNKDLITTSLVIGFVWAGAFYVAAKIFQHQLRE